VVELNGVSLGTRRTSRAYGMVSGSKVFFRIYFNISAFRPREFFIFADFQGKIEINIGSDVLGNFPKIVEI
jgi:hypothetical protein